jgi:glutaredoxin
MGFAGPFFGLGGSPVEETLMAAEVKIYSTPSCNLCEQAKKFLTEKGIDFEDFDITRDKSALMEMQKLSKGARTAPVISVCDKVLVGFNRKELEEAFDCD